MDARPGRRGVIALSGSDPTIYPLIFGLGYSGRRIVERLRANGGAEIAATVRDVGAATSQPGVRSLPFDGGHPSDAVTETLRTATHIVVTVPPGETGDPVLRHHAREIAEAPALRWIGYLSTIGVYGNHDGAWIDETAECRPRSPRTRARMATEQAWQALAEEAGAGLAVFRIAGIYGPDRNALANLAAGTAHRIVKPGQVFNRIHVDDLAAVVVSALRLGATGVFNVSDDEPAPPQDVVAYAARLIGLDPPPEIPFETADLTPMARSFYGDNKRVRSTRLKRELGVALAFPTYREGLAALAADAEGRD